MVKYLYRIFSIIETSFHELLTMHAPSIGPEVNRVNRS
jgi:hypothetical protein